MNQNVAYAMNVVNGNIIGVLDQAVMTGSITPVIRQWAVTNWNQIAERYLPKMLERIMQTQGFVTDSAIINDMTNTLIPNIRNNWETLARQQQQQQAFGGAMNTNLGFGNNGMNMNQGFGNAGIGGGMYYGGMQQQSAFTGTPIGNAMFQSANQQQPQAMQPQVFKQPPIVTKQPETFIPPQKDKRPENYRQPEPIDPSTTCSFGSPDTTTELNGVTIRSKLFKCTENITNVVNIRSKSIWTKEVLWNRVKSLPCVSRGDKYFRCFEFCEPVILDVSRSEVLAAARMITEEFEKLKKQEVKYGGVSQVISVLERINRKPSDLLDKLFTDRINELIHVGALSSTNQYIDFKLKTLYGLRDLVSLNPSETVVSIQKNVPEFNTVINRIASVSLGSYAKNLSSFIVDSVSVEDIATLNEVVPLSIETRDKSSMLPTPNLLTKLFQSKEMAKGSAITTETAERCRKELEAFLAEFNSRFTVLAIPKYVIETNCIDYGVIKPNYDGTIDNKILVLEDLNTSDVGFFIYWAFSPSNQWFSHLQICSPNEFTLHKNSISMNLKLTRSADSFMSITQN